MTATEVYLPCDVGHVRVKLGFSDTLSPLEETALRVIVALTDPSSEADSSDDDSRRADIGTVAKLLGLGHRMVLDLVHDLWRAGYLVVDFSTNAIWLSQDVEEKLAKNELATLRGTGTEDCTVELMVERLTGHVMHCHGPLAPADPTLAVRFLGADTELTEASHTEIQQAVRTWLGQERHRRQRRILSIRSAPADRFVGAARRWYQVNVQAVVNPDTDDLIVTVTDRRLPADRRDLASDRLTRLAQDRPLEQWVTQLRRAAIRKSVTTPPVEELIDQLETKIAEGLSIKAGVRRAEHLDWAYLSRLISGLIREQIAHEVEAEVIVGEAHAATVCRLIDEAHTQVVLVSPRIVDYVLERFRPQLQAAIDRGVQIVILWGGGYKATLQDNVRNALDSLARRAKTVPVLRAQVSANSDARVVISDNRSALVTSRDLLATTQDRPDVGILLRRPDSVDSAALWELLGWARVNMPGAMSTDVLRHSNRFDRPSAADQETPGKQIREELPDEPPENIEDHGALQAWVMRWQAHLATLRNQLASRPLPAVKLVEDGAHRELLWRALRKAKRRLVIASGQLSDEVVNSRLIDAVTMLLAQGVAVTIAYDEQAGLDRGRGALTALTKLANAHPALLTVHGGIGRARALVCDDDVTVGSYRYLFHGGYGTVGGRHMLPSELSVRLIDPVLADRVAAGCGEPPEVTASVTGQAASVSAPAPRIDEAAFAVAQRILNQVGDSRPGDLIRDELRSVPDLWSVLDLLCRLAEPTIRRTAIAYCLAHGDPDLPTAIRWREQLVVELVAGGLFTEAQVVRAVDGVTAEEGVPRPAILTALSGHGRPDGDVLLEAACEDDLSADEQAALRAVCLRDLLASGSSDAINALEILTPGDGPWGELAALVNVYLKRAAGASTPRLMREVSRQRRADAWLEGAWYRLELALVDAKPLAWQIDGAKKTQAALYNDTGVFGRLSAMVARRDRSALRSLVEKGFEGHDAADLAADLLDRTWREVAPLTGLLSHRARAKYLSRLAAVISAARDLAAERDPADLAEDGRPPDDNLPGRQRPHLLAAAGDFAEEFQNLRPALADTNGVGPLAAVIAKDVLADLDRLMSGQWSEQKSVASVGCDDEAPSRSANGSIVPRWPGQWQYPELAVALWAGEAGPAAAAALLMRDLVEPLPPEQTARRLIKDGEFAAVEALRDDVAPLLADESTLVRDLQSAKAMAEARARYEAAALTRRARRAGLAASLDADIVSEQAQLRVSTAEKTMTAFRDDVIAAEENLVRDFEAAVSSHPAVLAGRDEDSGAGADVVDKWRRAVLACVKAHEFPSARHLLEQGPGEAYVHDPWIFAAPRPVWPFVVDTAERAVSWYFPDALDIPPRFESWRPSQRDTTAWGVLDAIRAQLLEPSTRNAGALRDALQRLVGGNHLAGSMTPLGKAWSGRLYLPDNHRLPRLSLFDRDGIPFWIADSGTPPPRLDNIVTVWLVTDFGHCDQANPDTMILDPRFLFRLLASDEGETIDTESRLVNLVRQLGRQLDAQGLIGDAQPPFKPLTENEVAWLLDLLGVVSDGVVVDALHFDSGGRSEILVPLLADLLPPPVAGLARHHKLDVVMLNKAWDTGTWRATALRDLLEPLRGQSAALAASLVLTWVAAAFHEGPFTVDELPAEVDLVAMSEKQAITFRRHADLEQAARRLLQVGIFEATNQGQCRLPGNGIREMLAGVWPGHDQVALARDAIEAWFQHHEWAAAQSRAELSDRVVRTIGHRIANVLAAAKSAHARNEPEQAWRIVVDRMDSVHKRYRQALSGDEVLSLWDLLSDRKGETEFMQPAFQVTLPAEEDLAGLYVEANGWLLGQAFQNLFDNSRQAFETTGREFGEARVTVTVIQPSSEGAEPTCRIDIEDDGTGIDATVRAKFKADEIYSTRGERGTGLRTARQWFREYGGNLDLLTSKGALGGAWVRITLPLITAPLAASAVAESESA